MVKKRLKYIENLHNYLQNLIPKNKKGLYEKQDVISCLVTNKENVVTGALEGLLE